MTVYIDFETRSEIDLKKVGAWNYANHKSTSVLCMAYKIDDDPTQIWVPDLSDDKNISNRCPFNPFRHLIYAHNSFFEYCIWNFCKRLIRYDWPAMGLTNWRCSAAQAAACNLPRSLDGVAKALGLAEQKDMAGRRAMLKLSKPRKPTKNNPAKWHDAETDFETLYAYCKKDVEITHRIAKILPQLSEHELQLWQLDQKINRRGIYCDLDTVKSALEILHQTKIDADKEIKRITEGSVQTPGQIARIKSYCERFGYRMIDLSKESVEMALADPKTPAKVKEVLQIRQDVSRSSTKKYQAMLDRACFDNRIREMLMYHGAITGRWAGRGIQPQNFPKGEIKDMRLIESAIQLIREKNVDALDFLFDGTTKTLSNCLRGMLCASPDKTLIAADYNAIEARVLLWLAKDEGLNLFQQNQDIYVDMASEIYKIPITEVSKAQREMGKRAILGLGYQMGAARFVEVCWEWGKVRIDQDSAQKIVNIYRRKYKAVILLWHSVFQAAKHAIKSGLKTRCNQLCFEKDKNFLYCVLPSGRSISYYKPKISVEDGYERLTYMGVNSQSHKWQRIDTYGGKLVENATQAVARDLLADAMLRVEQRGYRIVLTVHDEIICEVPKHFGSVTGLEHIMCESPNWAKDIPIKAKGWKGKRFRK